MTLTRIHHPTQRALARFVVLSFLFLAPLLYAASERQPNVLLIMSDDQGWGDLSVHGNPVLETPRIDQLAEQSARLTNFHVSPLCAPTRASLLTGRYHPRTGVTGVTDRLEVMRANEVTVAELFQANGYQTGIFGKWHNGAEYPNSPNGQGFDEFVGFAAGHWNFYFDAELQRNGESYPTEGFIIDALTDEAMGFMERSGDKPFFCYVPYNTPHTPWQVPDEYYKPFADQGLDPALASAYGLCQNIDDNVGRLLDKLDALDLADNTIVIYLSDNGPNTTRYNGGMRGRKGHLYEGGTHVPFFLRWPGIISPQDVTPIAAHIDVLPTLMDLCGIQDIDTLPLDGRSLVPLLDETTDTQWADRLLFFFNGKGVGEDLPAYPGAVRTQRFRLVQPKKEVIELYDISADPGESNDVASSYPERFATLKQAYEDWFEEVRQGAPASTATPVGYGASPLVELNASSAKHSGGTEYVNIHGWAHDWIHQWRSLEDRIWWNIDVVEAGRFEVEFVYATPSESLGAEVVIEAGRENLRFKISESLNTEKRLRPDRDPTVVRWVRDFLTVPLGSLRLSKGETRLTLRAASIPGPEVARFSSIRLKRVE